MKRILIALVALAFAFAIPRRLNTTRASGVAVGAISSLKKWQRNLRRKRVYRDGKERLGSITKGLQILTPKSDSAQPTDNMRRSYERFYGTCRTT
jgi:hypothetical protein